MVNRNLLPAVILWTACAVNAAPLNWTPQVHPVPVIPHGLDWSIQLAPDPQPIIAKLSDEDLTRILPPVLKLQRLDVEYDFANFGSSSTKSPIGPFTAIVTGLIFLVAAYDLIPRIHLQVLRFRSVDLRQNLLT